MTAAECTKACEELHEAMSRSSALREVQRLWNERARLRQKIKGLTNELQAVEVLLEEERASVPPEFKRFLS